MSEDGEALGRSNWSVNVFTVGGLYTCIMKTNLATCKAHKEVDSLMVDFLTPLLFV